MNATSIDPFAAAGLTPQESTRLRRFLDEDGRLRQYPSKRSTQLAALRWLATHFEHARHYTQKDVDEILQDLHSFADWVLLRRELIDAGLLDRTRDCSTYWKPPRRPTQH